MLKGNLGKVVSMANAPTRSSRTCWLHSRQESGEHRPVGINALVAESLISLITAHVRQSRASTSRRNSLSTRPPVRWMFPPGDSDTHFEFEFVINLGPPKRLGSKCRPRASGALKRWSSKVPGPSVHKICCTA